jgi:cytochrome c-type biogenesis protein CcmH/NrfG
MKALLLILAGLFVAGSALGAGDPVVSESKDPVLEKVSAATRQQDWAGAAGVLRDALAADPNNPNYHNLYAYSVRKGAKPDMNLVFKHYNEALRIDPKHRGAHEYIGEAYLMTGNVAKAKEHLAQLERLCRAGCAEQATLKKEITTFEQQHASK